MTMHVSPSIIDIPDIMARRHLTPGAASTETREEWIENHYLGAFPSREVCAAQLADDYGVLGDDALGSPGRGVLLCGAVRPRRSAASCAGTAPPPSRAEALSTKGRGSFETGGYGSWRCCVLGCSATLRTEPKNFAAPVIL